MKKIFSLILFITLNGYSQKTVCENFTYDNRQINYYYTYFNNNFKTSFNIIINNQESKEEIIKCLKNSKKVKPKTFFLSIPNEISSQEDKEKLILEFITNILRRKLIDHKMNIISDFDYFKLYEETRKVNNGHYKYSYLNPINSLTILKKGENVCVKIN